MQHRYLPNDIIELVFAKLVTTYGARFARQYEGADISAVKQDWQYELAGFTRSGKSGLPEAPAVLYALQHLPEQPPNVLQFRAICRRWTENPDQPRLGRRVQIPDAVRAAFARLKVPASAEPERIRVARRYLATFGGDVVRTPMQSANVAHYRAVLARWERTGQAEPEQEGEFA